MNRDNVVSFDAYARGRSARRGADDKLPFETEGTIEVECPRCAAVLRLDLGRLSVPPEVLCAGCDAMIAFRPEVLDVSGG